MSTDAEESMRELAASFEIHNMLYGLDMLVAKDPAALLMLGNGKPPSREAFAMAVRVLIKEAAERVPGLKEAVMRRMDALPEGTTVTLETLGHAVTRCARTLLAHGH
ncbi:MULTISPECIES: hypothetical protein [Actinosynnema]|uniref:hypothetical protein n=1 Tax=Actinosynnema TaxID=40566 RepID=UPI0020A23DAD|nr:hypothetical protein [Actinosynnema pretiosum]MCP2097331.1 hypothetical protein [Actinosynnema pretiosum]